MNKRIHRHWPILLSLLLVISTRLPYLNTGINVMEPDEWDYQHISQSIKYGWPTWHGELFLSKHVFFVYLGYLISNLFPSTISGFSYVNLRLISILACLFYVLGLDKFLKNINLANLPRFIALLLASFTPLLFFYSRMGTYELCFAAAAMWVIVLFQHWLSHTNTRNSIYLGISFALAMTTKHINILLAPIFLQPIMQRKITFKLWFYLIIFGLISYLIFLLPMIIKSGFMGQYVSTYEGFFVFHPRAFVSIWWEYLQKFNDWITVGNLLLSVIGLVYVIKHYQKHLYVLMGIFTTIVYLGCYYVNSRSFIALLPWLAILVGFGLKYLWQHYSLKNNIFVYVITLFLLIPNFIYAYQSTLHTQREAALNILLSMHQQYPDKNIFTTLDSKKTIASLPELNIKLLDQTATSGSIIFIDELSTTNMLNLTEPMWVEAKTVLNQIKSTYQPTTIIADPLPHFPWKRDPNTYSIYLIP